MGGKNSYESIKRYEDKAYDKVLVRLPKGKKEIVSTHAAAHGESVNRFINRALDETITRDKQRIEDLLGYLEEDDFPAAPLESETKAEDRETAPRD